MSEADDGTGSEAGAAIHWIWIVLFSLLFVALAKLSWFDQFRGSSDLFPLILHTLAEGCTVLVSFYLGAALLSRRELYGAILASGLLGAGLLDLAHLLSYQGMPVIVTPAEPQKAIIFWLAARIAQALTLLPATLPVAAAVGPWRRLCLSVMALYVAVIIVLQLWWPQLWPVMFVPGRGLTAAKVTIEYGFMAVQLVSLLSTLVNPVVAARFRLGNLQTALVLTIFSDLCFTLYPNVTDLFSLLGHIYKLFAYFFLLHAFRPADMPPWFVTFRR